MTIINHHPEDELLLDYSAGKCDAAFNIVVASHVGDCVRCQNTIALHHEIAGDSLRNEKPAKMATTALDVMKMSEDASSETPEPIVASDKSEIFGIDVPPLLSSYLPGKLDNLKWKKITNRLKQAIIKTDGQASLRLLWMAPGTSIPAHGHKGQEMALILSGGYYDGDMAYTKGDLHFADHETPHIPVAMEDGPCLVLAATDGPLIFSGLIPRLLQPLLKI